MVLPSQQAPKGQFIPEDTANLLLSGIRNWLESKLLCAAHADCLMHMEGRLSLHQCQCRGTCRRSDQSFLDYMQLQELVIQLPLPYAHTWVAIFLLHHLTIYKTGLNQCFLLCFPCDSHSEQGEHSPVSTKLYPRWSAWAGHCPHISLSSSDYT